MYIALTQHVRDLFSAVTYLFIHFTLGGKNFKINCIYHGKGGHQISRVHRARGGVWQKSHFLARGEGVGCLQGSHIISRDI